MQLHLLVHKPFKTAYPVLFYLFMLTLEVPIYRATQKLFCLFINHKMISKNYSIFLADDDKDDCLFFKEALEELPITTNLTTVHDGEQLMQLLAQTSKLPHVLFLDLNMPRKNGFSCLEEIKRSERLKSLPVIMFSTSPAENTADMLYTSGAHFYICKPANFLQLKRVIHEALILLVNGNGSQPAKENFMLTGNLIREFNPGI